MSNPAVRITPRVSVVLASRGELRTLNTALAALQPAAEARDVEVVVVRAGNPAGVLTGGVVRVIAAPADASAASLRAMGMREAKGDVVILTDDDSAIHEPWAETLARRSGSDPRPHGSLDLQTTLAAFGILAPGTDR
ncbi:MAG: glycosyltransferase family 2 protein [Gemmatimonadota bacterium]